MLVDHPREAVQQKSGKQKCRFMYRNLITGYFIKTLDKEVKPPGQGHVLSILGPGSFSTPKQSPKP